jgi:hypothetical protein
MFPSFPNMAALLFFGMPLLGLIFIARSFLKQGKTGVRGGVLLLTIAAALLGFIGEIPGIAQANCREEWFGLGLASGALCLSVLSGMPKNWRTIAVAIAALYLTCAWALLLQGCLLASS